jgi:transposase-like protein
MWKSLRTTNALENLNRELRRRTKTQASFSTEQAAVTLLVRCYSITISLPPGAGPS